MYIYKPEVIYSYTPEDILNMLTNNGAMDGLFIEGNQIYMKGTYIRVDDLYALKATLAGWKIGKNNLTSATGNITLYSDGRIKIEKAVLSANGKGAKIKYGLSIYTTRSDDLATSDDGEFKLYGLSTVSSGRSLVIPTNNNIVSLLSSSSKRYKKHVREMSQEEADKLLSLPVVWFQYRDGYLDKRDPFCGKPMPGFYADDLSEIFPECVIYNGEDQPEDWNYRVLVPVMMKVIQGQSEKISTLEDTVNTLNERLNEIEKLLKGVVK